MKRSEIKQQQDSAAAEKILLQKNQSEIDNKND